MCSRSPWRLTCSAQVQRGRPLLDSVSKVGRPFTTTDGLKSSSPRNFCPPQVLCVVGLGNPESHKYNSNRHNAGAICVMSVYEKIRANIGVSESGSLQSGDFKAHFSECTSWTLTGSSLVSIATLRYGPLVVNEVKIVLARPQTYMNLSGGAVRDLLRRFKVSPSKGFLNQLVVVHDDLDLEVGVIKARKRKYTSGFHNGVIDIVNKLPTDTTFVRYRVGIGRPCPGGSVAEYVLQNLSPAEEAMIKSSVAGAIYGGLVDMCTKGLNRCVLAFGFTPLILF